MSCLMGFVRFVRMPGWGASAASAEPRLLGSAGARLGPLQRPPGDRPLSVYTGTGCLGGPVPRGVLSRVGSWFSLPGPPSLGLFPSLLGQEDQTSEDAFPPDGWGMGSTCCGGGRLQVSGGRGGSRLEGEAPSGRGGSRWERRFQVGGGSSRCERRLQVPGGTRWFQVGGEVPGIRWEEMFPGGRGRLQVGGEAPSIKWEEVVPGGRGGFR